MRIYYERRAREYDASTYELLTRGDGLSDLRSLQALVASLNARRVLDVGCGSGWLTRFVHGDLTLVDQSESMLEIARRRNPAAAVVRAAVPPIPFADNSFDLALAAHLYSHFPTHALRRLFLAECQRVASALLLIEQTAPRGDSEGWEERQLADGTAYPVFKRYRTAHNLAAEVGGMVVLETSEFTAVYRDDGLRRPPRSAHNNRDARRPRGRLNG